MLAWDGRAFHYCPAFQVEPVDTTGAGDLFHAGFAYSFLNGMPLDAALEFSSAAAALNCLAPGARGGIQSLKVIHEFIKTGLRRPHLFDEAALADFSTRAVYI